jgi:hypothetical protein
MHRSSFLAFVLAAACGSSGASTGGGDDASVDGLHPCSPTPVSCLPPDYQDAPAGCAQSAQCVDGEWQCVCTADGDGSVDGGGGAAGDSPNDGIPPADAPFACGTTTCQTTQLCVYPCCGGTAPPCDLALDGGACAPGFHSDPSCPVSNPCRADPCTPAPPYCQDPMGAPRCGPTEGHEVHCVCA